MSLALSNVSKPAMQQSEDRLLTFVNWPSRIPVRPDQLAQAGFYYVGLRDCVKCFCCYGVLQGWQSGDDPWVEHTKWFPRCEYVLQEKGQEFVHQIHARFPQLFKQLLTDRDNSSRECVVDPPVVDLGLGEERTEDAIMMNTPVIKSALEMGFERSLIKQTVQSKILTGENYETVDELVSELVSKVVDLGLGEERTEDAIMMNTSVIKSALEMGFERSLIKQTVQSKILTGENYETVDELVSELVSKEKNVKKTDMSTDPRKSKRLEALIRNDETVRIVMVGKSGNGKSATGNTILGFKAFESKFSIKSVTTSCDNVEGVVAARKVSVVDTPGLFDTKFSNDTTSKEIRQCISLAAPGPHVFLVVIKLGRFTEEEQKSVAMIQKLFGEMSNKYTMILFTGGDLCKDLPVEELLETSAELQELIRKCEGRYHVFNNENKDPSQVTELMEKISKMLEKNGRSHYTTEMFQKVEKAIEEEKQRILKENEEERRKEEEELKKKCDGEALEKDKKIKEEQARCAREIEEKIRKMMEELKKQEQQNKYARELEELKKRSGKMEKEHKRQRKEHKETSKREIEDAMRKIREEREREARKQAVVNYSTFGAVARGAMAGGGTGAAIGTWFGPMGTMVGGTMGAAVGGIAGYFEVP